MHFLMVSTVLAVTVIVSAYGFLDDQHLTGPYRLVAADTTEQMSLMYGSGSVVVGCIEETVYAVGWNERYLVAKQHPRNNRAVTNCFYLDMSRGSTPCEPQSLSGPLTKAQFESAEAELQLPKFSVVIHSLE